jgi:hypothetical protein
MNRKYMIILLITLIFNIIIFGYYLANSDINPSIDAFYYLALADSFYQGTGLVNITPIRLNQFILRKMVSYLSTSF